MKKPTIFKTELIVLLILFSMQLFAQNYVPFSSATKSPRFDRDIKGDMILIGNNILGPSNNDFNDVTESNDNVDMRYIDIDSDGSTFSSSSANLQINSPANCYQIVYAGLYWSAVNPGTESISNVRMSGPNGVYHDIIADDIIFEAGGSSVDGGRSFPYACYADVTNIVRALPSNIGTYTVANVSSAQGRSRLFGNRTGHSAGWSLYIVYEDPSLTGKSITSFDGFSAMSAVNNSTLDVPISGFRTVPAPAPVRAKFAFAALEGDRTLTRDRLRINGNRLFDASRGRNNFFNSTVSSTFPRQPSSANTLGFDTGIIDVLNANNDVIDNDDTSAVVRLETDQDTYFPYFFAFSVDIIAPNIILTKTVEDPSGNDIGGQLVGLGEELNYVIGFHNSGNDDATDLTIRDVLPRNIVFDYPADMGLLPPGVTVQSYTPATREIVFRVDDSVIEENDPVLEIRFRVTVVRECSLLNNACDNIVSNQAFSTYRGTMNPLFVISDDPSFSTNTACLLTPGATNFLADISCTFEEDVILCGSSIDLVAGDDYDSYEWRTSPTGPVIWNQQTYPATAPGTYYVHNTATAPCQSIDQVFNVITFGAGVTNPVIPFADQVVQCPNGGTLMPNIFMCGASDTTFIDTNITDADSIIWYRLDESSCTAVTNINCPNEDPVCNWGQVGTGPDYLVDSPGQYRLILNYTGGCRNLFYFNVYENELLPTETHSDIICTTPGEIVIGDVPSGYEYSLDNATYQPSNVFAINTPGVYTVYIRQIGVTPNPCIFTVPNIQIRERNFTVTTAITQPLCHGGQGSVLVAANDVRPQYYYSISNSSGTIINSVGPIAAGDYTFSNLNAGTYTINVSTDDGCAYTGSIDIVEPDLLEATVAITRPLTCGSGEITISAQGGTTPYFYYINGDPNFQLDPRVEVLDPGGVYNITVVDNNNCSTTTSITVDPIAPPVYTVTETDILCYSDNGQIVFNVTNANGYTIAYSIDNGATFVSNPTFSNLSGGTYQAMIRYSLGGVDCLSTAQDITIDAPNEALTASSGVSELAGCGPSGEGRLRITNPQGGTPPYEYSFDNQATWVGTNEAYVMPGTYTLYIRDASGCIYAMPEIILDPEPVPPTITVSNPDYNCDGTATSTVVVNNTGGPTYQYTYLLDGVPNPNTTDPRVFLNVPNGPHNITVQYNLLTVPSFSNLLNEDFGYGADTTSPGINTTFYCFERQVAATQCKGSPSINDGDYSVTSSILHPFGTWINPVDHTPPTTPPTPNGRYLAVNIGDQIPTSAILYEKTISDIIPNQPINVEFFAINIVGPGSGIADPDLTVALIDGTGTEISSFSTGRIPKSGVWENYPKTPITLDPGANTTLRFIVRSNIQETNGNDVAIDDIRVFQMPVSCITEVNFPFVIDSNNAFTSQITNATDVTCLGASDGTITIAAQNFDPAIGFEYSTDNGTTWNTQLTSPHTITGLTAGTYDVLVRYDSTPPICMDTFSQDINAPALLGVNASATPVTCLVGSTVTATANGGTPAYSYELLDAATLNLVFNFPASGVLNNVSPGDYIIRVTDSNNCTADSSTTLNIAAPTNPTATIDATSDLCYDTTNASTIVVTASGGLAPYEYSLNSGPFGANNTFTNLTPGSYNVMVRDANGCTIPAALTQTIAPQLTISTALTKGLDCSATPDAAITGNISGGTPPYTLERSFNSGAYTPITYGVLPFVSLTANSGDFRFRVTDALGCTAESNVITINAISNPTASVTEVDPTCNGLSNGSVQITASGGAGSYTYSFNGSPFTTQVLYSGLAAGTYNYEVRDANQCIFSGTATLNEPSVLAATAAVAPPLSCSPSNTNQPATVTVTATAGTGTAPYQFSFNGSAFSATNTLSVNDTGVDQTINYTVMDAQGCTVSGSVVVTALDPPTDLSFVATPVTCLALTSDVTLTATGGAGALEYRIVSPAATPYQGSNVFTGLAPSTTYIFQVRDANGCYYSESLTIDPVINIAVTGTLDSNVSCNGGSDGAVTFTIGGFSGNYTYVLNGAPAVVGQSAATVTFPGLTAGNYTLDVTDEDTGCTDSFMVPVGEPANPLSFTAIGTNVFCTNFNSQITVTASGGTGPYTYAVVVSGAAAPVPAAYGPNNVITVDTNGGTDLNWDVYVLDANGCTATPVFRTVTVTNDPLPTINPVAQQCFTGSPINISLSGTVSVGLPSYSIGSGFQASPNFTIATPGTYTLTIRDGNGCEVTTPYVVDPQLQANATLTKGLDCTASPDATINVAISGGNANYTAYEVSINGAAYVPVLPAPVGASFTYTANAAGTYEFRITDTNITSGTCTVITNEITVDAIVPVAATDAQVDPTCNGSTDGSITLTATAGVPPFTYSIDGGATFVSNNVFGGLGAGTYNYVVRDRLECTTTGPVTLIDPPIIDVDIQEFGLTCAGNVPTLGRIEVFVNSGGTANYTYTLFDNTFTQIATHTEGSAPITPTHTFGGLNFGDYYVRVVDARGCEFNSGPIRINTTPDLNFTTAVDSNNCATGVDIQVNTVGGTAPYNYSIVGQPEVVGPANFTFTGLLHNVTYFLQVRDANNCIFVLERTTPPPPSTIAISGTATTNVTCNGADDGTFAFTVESYDGTVTNIDYQLLNALTLLPLPTPVNGTLVGPAGGPVSHTISALPPGNYVLEAREATGTLCAATHTFEITQPAQPVATAVSSQVPSNCNAGAQITLTTRGGTGPYTYAAVINGAGAPALAAYGPSNVITVDTNSGADLVWDIYVRDANGCPDMITVNVTHQTSPTINPVAQQCYDGTPFNITLVEGTGTAAGPLSYSTGSGFQASDTFVINAPGTYTLTIRDVNGCEASIPYVVEPQLLANANVSKELTCSLPVEADIDVTISGGTGIYTTYLVSTDAGVTYNPVLPAPVGATFTYTAATAGTYDFRITDSQGCPVNTSATVNLITNPIASVTPIDPTCNGGTNGSVQISATSGTGTYTYSFNGSPFTTQVLYTGLSANIVYPYVVRDSKGCEDNGTVTLSEPLVLAATSAVAPPLTCSPSNAYQPALVTVTATPGTGTAPYQFSFNGSAFSATNTLSVNDTGVNQTVNYTVMDAQGCTVSGSVVITALDPPTDLDFNATPVTCLVSTSDVTLTATGGVGVLEYRMTSPSTTAYQNSNLFPGLSPNIPYVFEVRDANGCYYTESFTANPVTNITVTGAADNDVSCNGGSDGAVTFTIGGFSGNYTYVFNGAPAVVGQSVTTVTFPGLTAGNYTLNVTDEDTGCIDSFMVPVREPANPLSFTATATNVFCTNFNSQITVTTTGGTGPYTYAAVVSGAAAPGPAAYGPNNVITVDTNLGADLSWDVYVLDANNCTQTPVFETVTIINDPLPTVTAPAMATCVGSDSFTFAITGSSGVLPLEYSIDGISFQAGGTFTVSAAGTYTVTVRDANGCTATSTPVTVYEPLDLTPAITALPSCTNDDGEITVTPIGGSGAGNYTYSISPMPGSVSIATNVISGVPAGTYTVTITDIVTTCTNTASVTLSAATPVTFTTTPTNVTCNGGSDGVITVNLPVSNDNPVYTYEITAPIVVAPQNSNIFPGLATGTYTVRVTSGRGCFADRLETVGEPNIVVPTVSAVQYNCNAGVNTPNFASITVDSAVGGSGTYTTYEFIRGGITMQSGTNNVFVESDLLGGTYTINVYDNNGCVGTTTETILPFINIDTVDITIDNPMTCTNDEDITVSVTSSGGVPANLEYTVEDVVGATIGGVYSQTNTTGVFLGLPIGNYYVTATNLDTGCSLQTTHYVTDPNTFDLTIDSVVDVTCLSGTDGSVNVTLIDRSPLPTDESGPFNYSIVDALGAPVTSGSVPNAGPVTLSNFGAGTYTITANLTNSPFCTVVRNFTITAPTAALAIQETHTEITCVAGNNDGTISATAVGGWPGPYEFQLEEAGSGIVSAFSSVSDFTGLAQGDYTVTVRDSRGCEDFVIVQLRIPDPVVVTATPSTTLLTCFNDNTASITASAVGGQGSNYLYTLNMIAPIVSSSGPQASPVFTDLGAGTYTVTVTDGFNCSGTSTNIIINEPSEIEPILALASGETCTSSATLTLSATGGTAPYSYSDTPNFVTTLGSFAGSVTFPVTAGAHAYYVMDANGCISNVSNEVNVEPLIPLTIDLDSDDPTISCHGDDTGSIIATAQGGLGNYIFTLQDGSGNNIAPLNQNNTGVFNGLVAGTYRVRIDSGDCVGHSEYVTITQPATPFVADYATTPVTCPGSGDGTLELIANGGTAPYTYAIYGGGTSYRLDQFFDTSTFENLPPGTYSAVVNDAQGCTEFIEDIIIEAPVPVFLTEVPGSKMPELCSGDMNGEFSVEITGGVLPYSVSIDDQDGPYITGTAAQTQFDFTGLAGGEHTVYVRDAVDCPTRWVITLPESVTISPEVSVEYGCTGNLSTNTVTVTIDESITNATDVDYSIDGGATYQASNVFVDVPAGIDYVVNARHTNGCEQVSETFDITQIDPLTLTLEDGELNEIVAVATGGLEPYEFTLNDEPYGSTDRFIIYASGDYTVTVTDRNGCVATATRYFEYIDVCISNYFTPNGDGDMDEWGPGCTDQYKELTVDVFDRYGRVVATLGVGDKWDGKYNGSELPTGDYWYVLKLNDPKDDREFVNHFTLYR
ncbi:T9SS type B sorting domain-containing protein [Flavivirga eckloniae]|uniref:MAM domain-containing protein n=1 Tax=Flavivirga eckloniae TaxID=1803846 RepID=A0A2K9PWA4_9FLAO|nr:T9SS type B sorting domain-containing protein [Flavivirga eckloniae]AUP81346.1 hypothetical protein C1H87_22540 [Flavivirga eckloniae]